ncbi:MAG: type I DNA topoisomerase [Candidatus Sumerlaeia bacterium]|nr:type I DNA topoisomerase [Candidatus Sumerlaeia bacterium]
MSKLVIVESPAKAKTIGRFLGKDYKVVASYGHVRDLPEKADEIPDAIKDRPWARFGVDLEGDFQPYYVVPHSKQKFVAQLRKAVREAEAVLLATDEDREGESISWHLTQVLQPKVPVRRIVFHEITPEAIRAALDNPRDVDPHLVEAQESRRILDRLFGYSLSPVLWRKVQSGLSAGRVQSVAVRLIVEREEERRAFVASAWWDLEATFSSEVGEFTAGLVRVGERRVCSGKDFDPTTGKLKARQVLMLDADGARNLAAEALARLPWTVSRVEGKPGIQKPAPPFTTSTLQQEANRKLGFSAQRTMRTAQGLYEGVDLGDGERIGLITYMRTDSVTLSERALAQAQQQIRQLYGADYARGPRQYRTKSRNAQEAHEAIRPTDLGRLPQEVAPFLSADEQKIYELVWKRTLASQMPDAEVLRTVVEVSAATSDGPAVFSASGKKILFPGYLRAYVEGSDDPAADIGDQETVLPDLREGERLGRDGQRRLKELTPKERSTQPPARYTEASLVKKLEEEGIGRPSTYASIIDTIMARGYVVQPPKSKNLVPTFTAMAVIDLMRKHFGHYIDLGFTARMEEELDEIADRKLAGRRHLHTFYRGDPASPDEQTALGLAGLIEREQGRIEFPVVKIGTDPSSGADVVVRIGRYGPFVALSDGTNGSAASVPENVAPADFTVEQALALIRQKGEGPRVVGRHPETDEAIYAALGRFGAYVQLGETPKDKKAPKPRRASLPRGMSEEEVDLATALRLLSLPRELGTHPESGESVLANIGRFGPYVQAGKDFRSLKKDDDVYTVGFERALELLAEPKGARGARGTTSRSVLKDLGEVDGKKIQVLDGRYGPYVTDGAVNATLPKDVAPGDVTAEQARALLAARAAAPAAKKGRKAPARKKADA